MKAIYYEIMNGLEKVVIYKNRYFLGIVGEI